MAKQKITSATIKAENEFINTTLDFLLKASKASFHAGYMLEKGETASRVFDYLKDKGIEIEFEVV